MKKKQQPKPAANQGYLEAFFSANTDHITPKDRAALREAAAKWMRGEESDLDDTRCPEWLVWEFRRAAKQ